VSAKQAQFHDWDSEASACRTDLWAYASVSRYREATQETRLTIQCQGDYNSAFPAGVNIAATWDRSLAYLRGLAMGKEFNSKGVDIQLGPVSGPLGRTPEGGRNWEGFSPDPMNTGVMMAETIKGIQDAGVIACAKHYILNEQEHFRLVGEANGYGYNITASASSNVDDRTMHELYLWYVHPWMWMKVRRLIFQAICRRCPCRRWIHHVFL
jgi:hypothetical protein